MRVVMSLTHGDTVVVYEKVVGDQLLEAGTSSTIQILRKNHKLLMMINGVEIKDKISVNFTEGELLSEPSSDVRRCTRTSVSGSYTHLHEGIAGTALTFFQPLLNLVINLLSVSKMNNNCCRNP